MALTAFRLVTIPILSNLGVREAPGTRLAEKSRGFRLLALKSSPKAFASTYEEESKRSIEQTYERLTNSKAVHFVALKCDDESTEQRNPVVGLDELARNEWEGFIVLLGPQDSSDGGVSASVNPFHLMTKISAGDDAEGDFDGSRQDQKALHFHLNGMFVRPAARGSGLGRMLIEAAIDRAVSTALGSDAKEIVVTIIVDEWNTVARSLYERCAFVVVARETYQQQGQEQADVRVALRMELRRTLG
ncbi:60S ribosomal protein L10A [Oleoguttula sp. CCFEE 5521]